MRIAVVGLVMVVSSAALAKPGGIVIPPAEVDVGAGVPLGDATAGTSTEVRAGLHFASLYWKPTRFDVGVGYAGSFRDLAPGLVGARMTSVEPAPTLSLNGVYVSAAYAIENHRFWRTWLGARAEMLTGRAGEARLSTTGVALRLATEMYVASAKGGADHSAAAFFIGSFAIGVYVEATRRSLPAELGPVGVAAGLTMRVPFIAAVVN